MCRTNMDPIRNCIQLACTEIRAENLSGECNFSWEVVRGKISSLSQLVNGHHQSCVKRRAIDSVRANPNCSGTNNKNNENKNNTTPDQASLYVDAVMERCYADIYPFERHPNQR